MIYLFYFCAILSVAFIISDISTWRFRVKAAMELHYNGETLNLSDWNNIQPVIQQHIIYALFLKYPLMLYCLLGLMSSQWIFFAGLIVLRLLFVWIHALVTKKWKLSDFNLIILPITYRILTIILLSALVVNRFHYKFLDI